MRGLLNYNIAAFEADNIYGFPEVFPISERVNCDHWLDFDTARCKSKPGAKRPYSNGTSGIFSGFQKRKLEIFRLTPHTNRGVVCTENKT